MHYSPKTFYYSEDNKEWVPGPDLIHGRWGHSAGIVTDSITDKAYLVVIGGRNETVLSCIEILNEVENKWEKGTVSQIKTRDNLKIGLFKKNLDFFEKLLQSYL